MGVPARELHELPVLSPRGGTVLSGTENVRERITRPRLVRNGGDLAREIPLLDPREHDERRSRADDVCRGVGVRAAAEMERDAYAARGCNGRWGTGASGDPVRGQDGVRSGSAFSDGEEGGGGEEAWRDGVSCLRQRRNKPADYPEGSY